MEPLTAAIVASLTLVVLLIAAASHIGRRRERTIARVAALQALAGPTGESGPADPPGPVHADDDWDLRLRTDEFAAVREYDPADDFDMLPAPVPAAPIVTTTRQFVVEVPDSAGARPWQMSFQQREGQS